MKNGCIETVVYLDMKLDPKYIEFHIFCETCLIVGICLVVYYCIIMTDTMFSFQIIITPFNPPIQYFTQEAHIVNLSKCIYYTIAYI